LRDRHRISREIYVPCNSCKARCSRFQRSEMYRRAGGAWARDMAPVSCVDYEPRLWRGVDGVLDFSSPHPSAADSDFNQRS